MTIMNKRTKIIISLAAVAAVVLLLLGVYHAFSPRPQEGNKAYTVTVTHADGNSERYEGRTDAEYLRGIMDELQTAGDFSYDSSDSAYGLFITEINGETADGDDGAYWMILVNDQYGLYGADTQPVADGDAFEFVYEIYATE